MRSHDKVAPANEGGPESLKALSEKQKESYPCGLQNYVMRHPVLNGNGTKNESKHEEYYSKG